MDNIKLYLRWMISKPIGDTMLKVSMDKDTSPVQKHDPHTSSHTAVSSPALKVSTAKDTSPHQEHDPHASNHTAVSGPTVKSAT